MDALEDTNAESPFRQFPNTADVFVIRFDVSVLQFVCLTRFEDSLLMDPNRFSVTSSDAKWRVTHSETLLSLREVLKLSIEADVVEGHKLLIIRSPTSATCRQCNVDPMFYPVISICYFCVTWGEYLAFVRMLFCRLVS